MMMQHRFVEYMPEQIEEGIIYISPEYRTVIHLCVCGCGEEVNTPLSPTDWKLLFNGKHISLDPSIGNWSFECRSHYWIKNNEVVWAESWTDFEVKSKRTHDKKESVKYYEGLDVNHNKVDIVPQNSKEADEPYSSFWRKITKWFK